MHLTLNANLNEDDLTNLLGFTTAFRLAEDVERLGSLYIYACTVCDYVFWTVDGPEEARCPDGGQEHPNFEDSLDHYATLTADRPALRVLPPWPQETTLLNAIDEFFGWEGK